MTEKIQLIRNPLTVIAIFAALAEINATVSIGLVDKELQHVFIWFVILFPTLLVVLFFITLNFNTEVIYAPTDYHDDQTFLKSLFGEIETDLGIKKDIDFIKESLDNLKSKSVNEEILKLSDITNLMFTARYQIEKEISRILKEKLDEKNPKPWMVFTLLLENNLINKEQYKSIKNIYSIASPVIHGDENRLTDDDIEFVKKMTPKLINDLRKI